MLVKVVVDMSKRQKYDNMKNTEATCRNMKPTASSDSQ